MAEPTIYEEGQVVNIDGAWFRAESVRSTRYGHVSQILRRVRDREQVPNGGPTNG